MPQTIDELNQRYGGTGAASPTAPFAGGRVPTLVELNSYNEKKRKEEEEQQRQAAMQQQQAEQRRQQTEARVKEKEAVAKTKEANAQQKSVFEQDTTIRQATPQESEQAFQKNDLWTRIKSFFGIKPGQQTAGEAVRATQQAQEEIKNQKIKNMGGNEGVGEVIKEGVQSGLLGAASMVESTASVIARKTGAEKIAEKLDLDARNNRMYKQAFDEEYRRGIVNDEYSMQEKLKAMPVRYVLGMIAESAPATLAIPAAGAAATYLGAPTAVATSVAVGMGALLTFGGSYQDARAFGLEENEAEKVGFMTALMSAPLEFIPEWRLLGKLGGKEVQTQVARSFSRNLTEEILSRVGKATSSFVRQGALESMTEVPQQVIENAWARTYNKNRGIFDGVGDAALSGFFSGGMMDTLVSMTSTLQSSIRENAGIEPATRGPNGLAIEDAPVETIPFVKPATEELPIVTQAREITKETIQREKNVEQTKLGADEKLLAEARKYKSAEEFKKYLSDTLDNTGHDLLRGGDYAYHVSEQPNLTVLEGNKSLGGTTFAYGSGISGSRSGTVYMIDLSKIPPENFVSRSGEIRIKGNIPQDAFINLGYKKVGEKMDIAKALWDKSQLTEAKETPKYSLVDIKKERAKLDPSNYFEGTVLQAMDNAANVAGAGQRIYNTAGEVIGGQSSGYEALTPWVPEHLRSNELYNQVMKNITEGTIPRAGTKRGELFEIVQNRINEQLELPTNYQIKNDINAPERKFAAPGNPKPIEGTGEVRTPTAAVKIEAEAVAKGLTDSFGDLPEYRALNMKEQAQKAIDFITKDPERAWAVAMGEARPPQDLAPEFVAIAIEKRAQAEGDIQTLQELANSKLTKSSTVFGQRLRARAERDSTSPVDIIIELKKAREEMAAKKISDYEKAKAREMATLKDVIRKSAPTKNVWDDFIKSLEC